MVDLSSNVNIRPILPVALYRDDVRPLLSESTA